MKILKAALCLAAAALVLAANTGVVYRVSVDGELLSGTYSARQLGQCEQVAESFAEEISRGSHGPARYSARPTLSLREPTGSEAELARALLSTCEGVSEAWQVCVDGACIGLCSDPTAFGELIEAVLAQYADPYCVAAYFKQEVSMSPAFTFPGGETELFALAKKLRTVTDVISVVP